MLLPYVVSFRTNSINRIFILLQTKQTNSLVQQFNTDNVSVHVTKVNRPRPATCPKPSRTSTTQVKRLSRVKQVQPDKFQNVSLNTITLKDTESTTRVYRAKRTSVHPENPNESLQSSSANQDIVSQATISLDSFNASIKVFYRLTKKYLLRFQFRLMIRLLFRQKILCQERLIEIHWNILYRNIGIQLDLLKKILKKKKKRKNVDGRFSL